jgi:hypothetical protein
MTDVIRIKRRPIDGEPGPPQSLAASELAYNEADDTLYYGKGDDNGRATEIVVIGGAAMLTEIAVLRDEVKRLRKSIDALREELGV